MVKMVNRLTKTVMWVAEDRVKEYTEAGHSLASDNSIKPAVKVEDVINPPTNEPEKRKAGRPKKK